MLKPIACGIYNAIVQTAPARWNVKQAGMSQKDTLWAELGNSSNRLL
jgi:hypothetical protein